MRIQILFNRLCCFAVLIMAFAAVSSCKKSTSTATTSVQAINASPDAGTVNLFLSGNLKTTTPVAYGNSSGYFSTIAGNQTGEVKAAAAGTTLATFPVSLGANAYYSVFVTGQTSTNNVTAFYAQDKLDVPSPGKAKIRFVHAVADVPSVDLMLNTNTVFSALAYTVVSDYVEVAAGTYSIRAAFKVPGGAGVGVTTAFNQTFNNAKIYTIVFKGAKGATSDALKLGLGVMLNN